MGRMPVVGLVSDLRELDAMPYHVVGDKYAAAVKDYARCVPVGLIPCAGEAGLDALVTELDGFVFTGSASNIHPDRYGGDLQRPPFDHDRDEFALALTRQVLCRRKPALFICRGFQELNVALGGTLHADLSAVGEHDAHHPDPGLTYDERYGPLHHVLIEQASPLRDVFGSAAFPVNSLHYQGLDQLGVGLSVHGRASDGLPEVVAVDDHPFAIGVQWHPEYRPDLFPANAALLRAFGSALRTWTADRALANPA